MPLASTREMLVDAKENGYTVGQYSINNLESAQTILEASQEENAPVILSVSEGAARCMSGFYTIVKMVEGLMHDLDITIPVAVHLNYGSSFEKCKEVIDAGFTSVMIDASHSPFEENVATTKKVVEYAHGKGVSVEAELDTVGGQEDDIVADGIIYVNPKEYQKLVEKTGIDTLAPALGSVHGPYKDEPELGFKEMEEINLSTGLPLVLHGGTSISTKDIQKAVPFSTTKININTENQTASVKTVRDVLDNDREVYGPRRYLGPTRGAVKETVKGKIKEFGTSNRAK